MVSGDCLARMEENVDYSHHAWLCGARGCFMFAWLLVSQSRVVRVSRACFLFSFLRSVFWFLLCSAVLAVLAVLLNSTRLDSAFGNKLDFVFES